MRVVLDTNVVASALLWGGTPERLIEFAGEGGLELFTSQALLAELAGILERAKFGQKLRQKNLSAAEIVSRYRELAETVEELHQSKRRSFAIRTTQPSSLARSRRAPTQSSPATPTCARSVPTREYPS